ncbi:MAG TPA: hypothetical protein VKE69_08280 [Planctomycetota bacterium]|nr:hypothetical protein [Planctomycetota bacterium]
MPPDDSVLAALRDLRAAVDGLRSDLRAKDEELGRLREAVSERDARLRALGEQTLHLLDLVHEMRAERTASPGPR